MITKLECYKSKVDFLSATQLATCLQLETCNFFPLQIKIQRNIPKIEKLLLVQILKPDLQAQNI